MNREFLVYSRKGQTDPKFTDLVEAGRLDIVHECIVASLFLSHGLRRNVTFHAFLNGPPRPPVHLEIHGKTLYEVRTDQQTWKQIFRKTLAGRSHPGITVDKTSFEALIRSKADETSVYVLEEDGKDISQISMRSDNAFVLGDHIGLPKTVEKFALRYGEKLSLGRQPYLAASCITILNYLLDRQKNE